MGTPPRKSEPNVEAMALVELWTDPAHHREEWQPTSSCAPLRPSRDGGLARESAMLPRPDANGSETAGV